MSSTTACDRVSAQCFKLPAHKWMQVGSHSLQAALHAISPDHLWDNDSSKGLTPVRASAGSMLTA